jgi:hypothetical protein
MVADGFFWQMVFGRWSWQWQIGFLSGVFKYYICSPPTKKKG